MKCPYLQNKSRLHSLKINQIFRYIRCFTPKRLRSLRGPSRRQCTRATQLLTKRWRAVGNTESDLTGPRFEL